MSCDLFDAFHGSRVVAEYKTRQWTDPENALSSFQCGRLIPAFELREPGGSQGLSMI